MSPTSYQTAPPRDNWRNVFIAQLVRQVNTYFIAVSEKSVERYCYWYVMRIIISLQRTGMTAVMAETAEIPGWKAACPGG
jgi:hypothetical protein